MIENLQDELHQLGNQQAKGSNFCNNLKWEMEGKKCIKKMIIINQKILATLRKFSNF